MGYFLGEPYTVYRAVHVTLTAPKHEELVVASGAVEYRKPVRRRQLIGRRWKTLGSLNGLLSFPITVPPNRETHIHLEGKTLARTLRQQNAATPVELRLVLADFHRARWRTHSVTVIADDLEREERRY